MTVIAFVPKEKPASGGWCASELNRIVRSFAAEFADGQVDDWEAGVTEIGDPQFYLLGPPPENECLLCVSRLGRLYVLEDGTGCVLFEHADFELLARQAKTFLKQRKTSLLASFVLTWGMLRHAFEEKVEPLLAEGEDLLMHFAPQLAAFA